MDIKKEVSEIMVLAYEVSTTTKSDVFVRYSGHVNSIDIDVHRRGWYSGATCSIEFDIRLKKFKSEDQQEFEENLQSQLEEVQLYLITLGVADE